MPAEKAKRRTKTPDTAVEAPKWLRGTGESRDEEESAMRNVPDPPVPEWLQLPATLREESTETWYPTKRQVNKWCHDPKAYYPISPDRRANTRETKDTIVSLTRRSLKEMPSTGDVTASKQTDSSCDVTHGTAVKKEPSTGDVPAASKRNVTSSEDTSPKQTIPHSSRTESSKAKDMHVSSAKNMMTSSVEKEPPTGDGAPCKRNVPSKFSKTMAPDTELTPPVRKKQSTDGMATPRRSDALKTGASMNSSETMAQDTQVTSVESTTTPPANTKRSTGAPVKSSKTMAQDTTTTPPVTTKRSTGVTTTSILSGSFKTSASADRVSSGLGNSSTEKKQLAGVVTASQRPAPSNADIVSPLAFKSMEIAHTERYPAASEKVNLDIERNNFPLETIKEESARSTVTRPMTPTEVNKEELLKFLPEIVRTGVFSDETEAREFIHEARSAVRKLATVETPAESGRIVICRTTTVKCADWPLKVRVIKDSTQELVYEITFEAFAGPVAVTNLELGTTYRVLGVLMTDLICDRQSCYDSLSNEILFTPMVESPVAFVLVKPEKNWKGALAVYCNCCVGGRYKFMHNTEVTETRLVQAILKMPATAKRLQRVRMVKQILAVTAVSAAAASGAANEAAATMEVEAMETEIDVMRVARGEEP